MSPTPPSGLHMLTYHGKPEVKETITGYHAARDRIEQLEADYLRANPGDCAAGWYLYQPYSLPPVHSDEWQLVFSPTKYTDLFRKRRQRAADFTLENELFGPYVGARSDEVAGF